ncbi:sigma-70 family RNA polymerase sigma factor [Haliangium ochraceum]|uniref:RNA polymerase, sigma-24 subunit, ECF subfamily n=1 Tax=Haliangium ochraceum (strain DSM 14365 / JCM 11303 / SMP-2) TaxID=502025 RepID=D0LM99_HALO1|nr:sigma-70 family RNA polymerase sigma factor [Haliangium ochraceum]ACY16805.1 RNA polymerase, sigma-24 subunit, ECF subfamily [Haliangium ochraceum DSM 14365]
MQADIAHLEEHRSALRGHCYRMLGSATDADDAVQETMVRAWRNSDRFEGRSALRTWLYRIATNVCLDALADRTRRARPMEEGPAGTPSSELVERQRTHWLEPVPVGWATPADADPAERTMLQQSIRLAFVSALQKLPPKQRAALILSEVLGWSAAEVADGLDTSVAAVNSALQRARATMRRPDDSDNEGGDAQALSDEQQALLERYVDAFRRYDVAALTSLLHEDATFSMPPYALWLQGPEAVAAWLEGRGSGCRGSRLEPAPSANGLPTFAQYRPRPGGGHSAWALVVLELEGAGIAGWNSYLDTETLFPLFGLPLTLE